MLSNRTYLVAEKDGTGAPKPFDKAQILYAAEVIASGTSVYSIRFLIPDPPPAGEFIQISAVLPGSATPKPLWKLEKKDFKAGQNNDYWASVDSNKLMAPLGNSDLLVTQIRTAAERGRWLITFEANTDDRDASGWIAPTSGRRIELGAIAVNGLAIAPKTAFAYTSRSYRTITFRSRIDIQNPSDFGKIREVLLAVKSQVIGGTDLLVIPLRFVGSNTFLDITDDLEANQNDLDQKIDSDLKLLAIAMERNLAELRLTSEKLVAGTVLSQVTTIPLVKEGN